MDGRKGGARAILHGVRTAAAFELAFKLTALVIAVPLLFGSFALAMRAAGYAYLTNENLLRFLGAPLTVLAMAVNIAAGAAFLMVDVSAVQFMLDQSLQGTRVSPGQTLRFAVANARRAFRWRNLPLVLLMMLAAPFLHIGFVTVFFTAVSIPAPVAAILESRPWALPAAAGAALMLAAVCARWLYAACCFTVEGCSAREAAARCARLRKGRRLRDLAVMLAIQAVHAAVSVAALLALTALAKNLGALACRLSGQEWPEPFAVWLAVVAVLGLTAAFAVPVSFGCAGLLYYRARQRTGQSTAHIPAPPSLGPEERSLRSRALKAAGAAAVAAGAAAVLLLFGAGKLNPDVEYLHATEITAHRGASSAYPENTMAAFYGAAELGADWIELDVQQSLDGQLVVMHDADLKRTTGVNGYVRDMTYEQLSGLDAGQGGEKIPLLSEVLAFAQENEIRLNIELKPSGGETGMERAVVDAVCQAGLEDRCLVTSQSYRVLENVKAYDETIATGYIMRFAIGNIAGLTAADCLSVKAENVTGALVSGAHNAGKRLLVWTVNTRRSMEKMIGLNVDNIITDDVDLARQCVIESRYSEMLEEYIDLLE